MLRDRSFLDVPETQRTFDPWRQVDNTERPHEALSLAVPASRYRVSERAFPETLSPLEYAPDVQVRRASTKGVINRAIRVSQALGANRSASAPPRPRASTKSSTPINPWAGST